MESKKCTQCGEVKAASEFYKRKTKAGTFVLMPDCIPCHSERNRIRNLNKRNSRPKVVIEDLPGEMWVPVIGFEDKYRISNLGRVKSVDRWVFRKIVGKDVFVEGKLLAQSSGTKEEYPMVTFYGKTTKDKYPLVVYPLVFFSFNRDVEKKKGFEVDHIDQDRKNSNLTNLQYIPSRENSLKRSFHNERTSKYPGVSRSKGGKWQTGIRHNGGKYSLGIFELEEEAAEVYRLASEAIKNGRFQAFLSEIKKAPVSGCPA